MSLLCGRLYGPGMAGLVIGMDAGGTKLLTGVVDERLGVRQRSTRLWRGTDLAGVLDTMVEAGGGGQAAQPAVEAGGRGNPGPRAAGGGAPLSPPPRAGGGAGP